jgi:COP9 signalosome complex subunit 3
LQNGSLDPKYVLLYYYYGGMVYSLLKEWDKALFMFQMCVTTPAMAVSHIMLEAYKKHILVSLIRLRKVPALPKYTSNVVNRFFKHLALPYHDLINAFSQNDPAEFDRVVTKHTEVFTRYVRNVVFLFLNILQF